MDLSKDPIGKQIQFLSELLELSKKKEFTFPLRILESSKFKREAIKQFLIENSQIDNEEFISLLEDKMIASEIGLNKRRVYNVFSVKPDGGSPGALVKKYNFSGIEASKYNNIWLIKFRIPSSEFGSAELICEYIAANIRNQLMETNLFSPKTRLQEILTNDHRGELGILSKFIPNFKTLISIKKENPNINISNIFDDTKGFGRLFSSFFLTGNYDLSLGNIGMVNHNGNWFFAGVDDGAGLSYHEKIAFKYKKQHYAHSSTVSEKLLIPAGMFAEMPLDSIVIPVAWHVTAIERKNEFLINFQKQDVKKQIFQSIDFAGEIFILLSNININKLKKVINLCLKHIKDLNPTLLLTPELMKLLSIKLARNMDCSVNLEIDICEVIIQKISENNIQLKEMAFNVMKEIFPLHTEQAFLEYQNATKNHVVDYAELVFNLSRKGVDFNNPNHFTIKPELHCVHKEFLTVVKHHFIKKNFRNELQTSVSLFQDRITNESCIERGR